MNETLADFSGRLALTMLQHLYQPGLNMVFSPYSLVAALFMLIVGTGGNSRAQLAKAFFGTTNIHRTSKYVKRFTKANARLLERNANTIAVANFIYMCTLE